MNREERLANIRQRRDKCYAGTTLGTRHALPELHRDCYWLLEQLQKVREAIGMHDGGRIDEQDAYNLICEIME